VKYIAFSIFSQIELATRCTDGIHWLIEQCEVCDDGGAEIAGLDIAGLDIGGRRYKSEL